MRDGLARVFEEAGRQEEFDAPALRERCGREVALAIEALGLPQEQADKLREALEAEEGARPLLDGKR